MTGFSRSTVLGLTLLAALAACIQPAIAETAKGPLPKSGCQGHTFLVNDYGKEGPTRDAKSGLDGAIALWASKNGIVRYKTGPKSVTCELYLDFGFFDEWTCKAKARVCW